MSKVITLLLVAFFNLYALEWHTYEEAIKVQEKNSKIIMIDVVRTHCQYCVRMDKNVFQDEDMSKWVDERFIPVKINLDMDDMPLDVEVNMTPTFYFLNKDKKLIKVIPGSWNIQDFKDLTKKLKDQN